MPSPEYMKIRSQWMPECSIDGCSNPEHSRGWCNKHYQRWYVHGDVNHQPPPRRARRLTPEQQVEATEARRANARQRKADERIRRSIDPEFDAMIRAKEKAWRRREKQKPDYLENRRQYDRERRKDLSTIEHRREMRAFRAELNREYETRQRRRRRQDLRSIPCPRNGNPWTPAEDSIIMRPDLRMVEMCYMIDRSYEAVMNRRARLQNPHIPRRKRELNAPSVNGGTCSIENCPRPAYCRTWCTAHYQRWYKNGDPTKTRRIDMAA